MNKVIETPTGKIAIIDGEKGNLEFVSVHDYGKSQNIKADFLGFKDEINGVSHGELLPLQEKWVITMSTQYGCSMGCTFCDVPKVGPGINCTYNDLKHQLVSGLNLYPEVKSTKRLNIHFARMGEPTFNPAVLEFARNAMNEIRPYIGRSFVHPVISTMLPKNNNKLFHYLSEWVSDIKNDIYRGAAGLQFSINSTCDKERDIIFSESSLPLSAIAEIGRSIEAPRGRKFALNFAITDQTTVDADRLANLFDASKFMVKITPLHFTKACSDNNLTCDEAYNLYKPYAAIERQLVDAGFDVLVFIPSKEEDESRITCGNAILSDYKH